MSQEKTDKRISRSTAALRQALLDLMADKAFHAISVKEIVEKAGYNRGTFYAHYESKEMLLDDVFSKLIDELKQSFRAPYEEVEMFRIDELPANSVKIFDHFYRSSSVYTILFKSEVLPLFKEKISASLMQIAAEDLDYTHDSINREFLLIYSMNALLGLVFHWIESGFQYSPDYMQDQLVRMINWRPTSTKINKR
ncbi:TetR/AcrR family transcriptional regulator [Paenibacillus sp. Marseille-P2973]|uniref:TetR/AcrR family transcriptional regulator n=1 Tax=Paenibacillus sp. Marseille-P2973 TaxID=1871032 RepID=UPI001B392A1D|nr:TetR/AcrR family transcriptional regulator [Paenibacillus sp. Marseille-P2973]MBQ4900899.1 TetR/AcrR family transcriptional regulator [Paenibacillus sp. Marseille-P2973]